MNSSEDDRLLNEPHNNFFKIHPQLIVQAIPHDNEHYFKHLKKNCLKLQISTKKLLSYHKRKLSIYKKKNVGKIVIW